MKEYLTNIMDCVGLAFWIKIETEYPACTYYFGPFLIACEAEAHRAGYIEDLEQEKAVIQQVTVEQCKPTQLTIDRTDSDDSPPQIIRSISILNP
ncbi:MAG: DUF1816 domain-containing protein [Microcoleaceae cyanobacterium]